MTLTHRCSSAVEQPVAIGNGEAELEALGELEFRKQFLILNYSGGYVKVCSLSLSLSVCLLGFISLFVYRVSLSVCILGFLSLFAYRGPFLCLLIRVSLSLCLLIGFCSLLAFGCLHVCLVPLECTWEVF